MTIWECTDVDLLANLDIEMEVLGTGFFGLGDAELPFVVGDSFSTHD